MDSATQYESKCIEAYAALEAQAEIMQTKRTTLAQMEQQSEKFNELALLNKELSTLKSNLVTQDREKSEAALQAQHKTVADLEAKLVADRQQLQEL